MSVNLEKVNKMIMNNTEIQNFIIKEDLIKEIPDFIMQEIEKGNQVTITKVDGKIVMILPSLKKNS